MKRSYIGIIVLFKKHVKLRLFFKILVDFGSQFVKSRIGFLALRFNIEKSKNSTKNGTEKIGDSVVHGVDKWIFGKTDLQLMDGGKMGVKKNVREIFDYFPN